MQTHPTAAALRRRLIIAAALAACSLAQAQTAPAAPAADAATLAKYDKNKNGTLDPAEAAEMEADKKNMEGAIVLNPFEVSTAKDRGYAAANTLSGGRVDMPLELNPGSIQVMTKEFMEDFAITDMQDAAQWTMNVDLPNFGGDAPFGGNRNEFNIRGAGGAGNYPMRDGVQQFFVADAYNTDRFEVVSGPNSGQAGLGNSGGLVGSSSKRVRYNNRSVSVSTRADNFGGYRGTFDYNFATDRFGVRVNALHQNTKTIQEGTSNKQNGITMRAEFKVTPKTNLSFQFEKSSEWNTQYRRTYGDQQNLWNRTTVNADNSALLGNVGASLTTAGVSQISTTNDRLTYNFGTRSVINYRGNQYQTNGLNHQIPWNGNPNIPTDWLAGANMIRSVGKTYWLGPVDNFADRDNNTKTLTLDHVFSPNLTARLLWGGSDTDPVTYWGDFSQPGDFRVDVNRLLPDGTSNPNYLRSYSEWGAGGSQYQQNSLDEYSAEATYRFAVPRWFDLKQTFTGNYTHRTGNYTAWSRTWRRNNNYNINPDGSRGTLISPLDGRNALTYRAYHGDPQPRVQPLMTQQALNALMPGTTWGWYSGTGWHADSIRGGDSAAIYSSTSFFQDRLVITGNYKEDRIKNGDQNGISVNGQTHDAANNYRKYIGAINPATKIAEDGYMVSVEQTLPSYSLGAVVTPFPARWGNEGSLVQRWLSPIKLVWNYSENNREPTSGGPFYTGERPNAPFSATTDYAVRYSIPGGRAYLEIRRYFTENVGNLGNMANTANIQTIWRNLGYLSGGDTYDFQSNNYRDVNDRDLTGTEITLTANPTNSWTLTANYGHPRVQTVNDREYLRRYLAEHQAEWRAGALLPDGATVPGTNRVILSQTTIQTNIQAIEDGLNGLTPGTIGNGSLHRGSLNTSYSFREGKLRGLRVVGGLSWRGSSKVGSRDARLKFQTTAANLTVAQNVAAAYDYLWVPSQLTNNLGFNYTRRLGKVTARLQLNITNVLNDDTPQWTGYSVINAGQMTNQNNGTALTVAGSNPRMQVLTGFNNPEPRKFVFTTTFDF